jgi:hypothetical protein
MKVVSASLTAAAPPDVRRGSALLETSNGALNESRFSEPDCGCAAGCEAGLCPAVPVCFINWAEPPVRALPQGYGPKAEPGAQPKPQWM